MQHEFGSASVHLFYSLTRLMASGKISGYFDKYFCHYYIPHMKQVISYR